MSFRVDIEVPIEELTELEVDTVRAIHDWKTGILKEIKRASIGKAKRLAFQRMPGPGNYVNRIQHRVVSRSPKEYIDELYNDHEWAQAVETGTRPHQITSDKLMRAQPTLAVQGGKGRPYGTKYGPVVLYGKVFNHPGSRAFHIFRDTAKHIEAISKRIVEEVFRRIRKSE